MRFSVAVMKLACLLYLPFTLENPARSRIWLCPPMLKMSRNHHISLETFEMCMFGCLWRKATCIMAAWLNVEFLQNFRCLGAKRGCCKRTGKPHVQLCGLTPSGEWRTKAAQAYPLKLCQRLSQAFYDVEVSRRAANFEQRLK